MDVAEELRARALTYLEEQDKVLDEKRKELGVSDDLFNVEGLSASMVVALGENGVKTLDDLADLAGDELREYVGERNIGETAANDIIMAARAHWFEDEEA